MRAVLYTRPQCYIAGSYSTVLGQKRIDYVAPIQKSRQQGRLNGEEAPQNQREKHYRRYSKYDCVSSTAVAYIALWSCKLFCMVNIALFLL